MGEKTRYCEKNMSEWYEIKNQDDIEISEDGKMLEVLFNTNQFGNQYIEIPIKFIAKILAQPAIEAKPTWQVAAKKAGWSES